MSHQITQRDGLFTVREPAWHGLGSVLDHYPTREEAKEIAHPWEPVTEPVYRRILEVGSHDASCAQYGECFADHLSERYEQLPSFQATVRSDDGHVLGVTSNTLEIVTNKEMYDIAEVLEGNASDVRYETGGSLKGGAKVWLLLRLNEPLEVKGDPRGAVIPYYALQNSHDGTGAFRGQALMTRIVCDNTSQAADMEASTRGTEFTFRHTKNIAERVEEAKEALAGWRVSIEWYQRFTQHLLKAHITPADRKEFVDRFIPMPPPHMSSDRVQRNVMEARYTLKGILLGETCENIKDSAYGLVQASIEYQEHYRRAHTAETRFRRAYLDRSTVVADAVGLAREIAHV